MEPYRSALINVFELQFMPDTNSEASVCPQLRHFLKKICPLSLTTLLLYNIARNEVGVGFCWGLRLGTCSGMSGFGC